jgi:hypothetical protein
MKPEIVGKLDAFMKKFQGLYEKYEIDMIGYWSAEGDECDQYLLYQYDSEEDYNTKAGLLQEDSDYLALREEISEYRLSIEEIRLEPKWVPQ